MRTLKGTIVSDKMQKTVVVRVDRLKMHPKYRKFYRVSAKFKAHNPAGEYRAGDVVTIRETKPLSKDKRWEVVSLVRREVVAAEPAHPVGGEGHEDVSAKE